MTRRGLRNAAICYIEHYYNRSHPNTKVNYQILAQMMDAFFDGLRLPDTENYRNCCG